MLLDVGPYVFIKIVHLNIPSSKLFYSRLMIRTDTNDHQTRVSLFNNNNNNKLKHEICQIDFSFLFLLFASR